MNIDTFIYQYAKIVAGEFNVGISTLAQLALLNKKIYSSVQPLIRRCHGIYLNNFVRLGLGYQRKLINHPFHYTGSSTKIYSITGLGHNGIGILMPTPLSETLVYAIAGVTIIARSRCNYVSALYIMDMPIHISNESTVIDYISHTKEKMKQYEIAGFPNEVTDPGEYVQSLNIPLDMNPLPILEQYGTANGIFLALNYSFTEEEIDGNPIIGINNSPDCLLYSISHIIINYKTVSKNAYDWDNYGPMLNTNGDLSTNMHMFSVIRSIE